MGGNKNGVQGEPLDMQTMNWTRLRPVGANVDVSRGPSGREYSTLTQVATSHSQWAVLHNGTRKPERTLSSLDLTNWGQQEGQIQTQHPYDGRRTAMRLQEKTSLMMQHALPQIHLVSRESQISGWETNRVTHTGLGTNFHPPGTHTYVLTDSFLRHKLQPDSSIQPRRRKCIPCISARVSPRGTSASRLADRQAG